MSFGVKGLNRNLGITDNLNVTESRQIYSDNDYIAVHCHKMRAGIAERYSDLLQAGRTGIEPPGGEIFHTRSDRP
jgi:hypothetical protein